MSKILKQISMAFGAAIFILVAVLGVMRDVPFAVLIYRGVIAMSLATVVFMAFAFFFQRMLYRFVAEQIMMQKNTGDSGGRPKRAARQRAEKPAGAEAEVTSEDIN